jgi:hypothetical protein
LTVPVAAVELPLTKNSTLPGAPEGETVAERFVVPPKVDVEAVMLLTLVAVTADAA